MCDVMGGHVDLFVVFVVFYCFVVVHDQHISNGKYPKIRHFYRTLNVAPREGPIKQSSRGASQAPARLLLLTVDILSQPLTLTIL